MEVLSVNQARIEYLQTQITRSNGKFAYCKVSVHDAMRYRAIIEGDCVRRQDKQSIGPILCLGTRNGREVDLFRVVFFGPRLIRLGVHASERMNHLGFTARLPWLEAPGRSKAASITARDVIGVEINPRAKRPDIWIGSFDDMPADWERAFGVVYSNSFDQSEDPYRTAREWQRVLRPGGYLIVCFTPGMVPTRSDRVGDIRVGDIVSLFRGEMLFFKERGSRAGYSEAVLRLPKLEAPERQSRNP